MVHSGLFHLISDYLFISECSSSEKNIKIFNEKENLLSV